MVKKPEKVEKTESPVGHEMLFKYPTDLATPAGLLFKKFSGEDVPINCCIHAAVQIECVAVSTLYPDEHVEHETVQSMKAVKCPSDKEAKELLEQVSSNQEGPITDMILKQLLAFAIAKLNEWLSK